MNNKPVDIEKQVSGLTDAVSQLSESVSQLAQVATRNQSDISGLTNALGAIVTEFVRPTAKQALENHQSIEKMSGAISSLAEAQERHQDWLDEDRRDINTLRQETSSQITALIEQANADRKAVDERTTTIIETFTSRFDTMQAEIRQNQRLILAQGERLDVVLSEVLSLSRRVTAVEDAA